MGDTKICLDLFAGLGGFSAAFEGVDGWDVYTVDIEDRFDPDLQADVLDLRPSDLLELIGDRESIDTLVVLASPPCTQFSVAGNHDKWDFEKKEPIHDAPRESISLVYHTIGLIKSLTPDYWYLENPRGRLRWYLENPPGCVTYCQYGADWMKPTDLWGDHAPMEYMKCSPGSECHDNCSQDDDDSGALANNMRDPAKRSLVPYELSKSILDAVEAAERGDVEHQTTLPYTPEQR